MKIRDLEIIDLRFPTSRTADGTDAMHPDPDYSAAYVILKTDGEQDGHGFTFTIGRGNELCVAAIRALAPLVEGRTLESFTRDMGAFWRYVTGEWQRYWGSALDLFSSRRARAHRWSSRSTIVGTACSTTSPLRKRPKAQIW
jgi:L-alanine-DL-glutamate epimerase-like enolase superfamily enzyme